MGALTVGGVDSGVLTVEEVAAPEGYAGFTGSRALTLAVEGLDVQQVAARDGPRSPCPPPKPLRVDGADAASGTAEADGPELPASPRVRASGSVGLLPKTGERPPRRSRLALESPGPAAILLAVAIAPLQAGEEDSRDE